VQGGQTVPQPLRVVRAGPQVEVAVVDAADLRLRLRVRLDQVVRRTTGAELDAVAGPDAVCHLAECEPVDVGKSEHAAGLDVGAGEPVRLVEGDGGCAADDLGTDRGESLLVGPSSGLGQQPAADPGAPRGGMHEHLQHADVAEQEDVGVAQHLATLPGRAGRLLGDPGDLPLAGHRLREVFPEEVGSPLWIFR
jgi:hypothetical protein